MGKERDQKKTASITFSFPYGRRLSKAFDDLSVDTNVIEYRDGAALSLDYKYRKRRKGEENRNKKIKAKSREKGRCDV